MRLRYLPVLLLAPLAAQAGIMTAPIDIETKKVQQLELERQIFTEGTEARLLGKKSLDNPYDIGSVQFHAWDGGWHRADSEQYQRIMPK